MIASHPLRRPCPTRLTARVLVLTLLVAAAVAAGQEGRPAATRPSPDERGVSSARPRVYRDRVEPNWFADGKRFWYRNELPGGRREFVLVDAAKRTRSPAFDHAKVAAALAKLTERDVWADGLPIESLKFSEDGRHVVLHGRQAAWRLTLETHDLTRSEADIPDAAASLTAGDRPRPSRRTGEATSIAFQNRTRDTIEVYWMTMEGERRHYASIRPGDTWDSNTYDGHVWLAADREGNVLGVFEAGRRPATAVVGGTPATTQPAPDAATRPAERPQNRPRRPFRSGGARSPDGNWVIIAREYNLYLRSRTADGEPEIPLTNDGSADDACSADRVWWSPDSRKLVAMQTVPAQEHKIAIVESSPQDQVQPKLRTPNYLKPGDRIAHPRPGLFEIDGDAPRGVPVKDDLFSNPWSIQDLRWAADASRFTFVYNQRGHQVLRVISVDASTGAATALIDEQSDTFINYSGNYFCRWLGEDELLWMSERDGWNHLYLYDSRTGKVKNQVTQGEWVIQGVDHIDETNRQVWFRAGGVRPGQDPYYTHFCRVDLDGSNLLVLTEDDGTHRVQWEPGDEYFIDTYSRVDLPPVTELRDSATGALVCSLEEADATEVHRSRGGRWPMRFVAKGRDGKTDIYGVVLFPQDFDPNRKYPVVENIYAGPQGFFTPKAFRPSYGTQQRLADLGMIVVQCDGMGTSGRSKAFHDVCWQNLKDAGFPDRIRWIRAAAAAVPQMDLARVGIYGGSAGGQNAMAALLWHNDFYKVAVADCGCHDNRMDKIWWNEQWMGWPVGPAYEESSNVANAHRLQGKLMLIVGELDGNVDPASTMQAAGALQRAGKDFELVVVVGAGHGAAETPYGSRKRQQFLVRHLLNVEP